MTGPGDDSYNSETYSRCPYCREYAILSGADLKCQKCRERHWEEARMKWERILNEGEKK